MEVDDFYDVLRTLWMSEKMRFESSAYFSANDQRADNWLMELVKGYTGCRPGSLVEGNSAEDYPMVDEWDAGAEDAALPAYADCELLLIRSKDRPHDLMILTIKQTRTKGGTALTRPYDSSMSLWPESPY